MTGILKYWVKKAVKEDDLSNIRAICVDETSFKKGHSYVTVISDALARRVIDVEKPGIIIGNLFISQENFLCHKKSFRIICFLKTNKNMSLGVLQDGLMKE